MPHTAMSVPMFPLALALVVIVLPLALLLLARRRRRDPRRGDNQLPWPTETGAALHPDGAPRAPEKEGEVREDPDGLEDKAEGRNKREERNEREERGIFHGVRVVEISTVFAAPSVGRMLADLGAEVIKVEGPGGAGKGGDMFRSLFLNLQTSERQAREVRIGGIGGTWGSRGEEEDTPMVPVQSFMVVCVGVVYVGSFTHAALAAAILPIGSFP